MDANLSIYFKDWLKVRVVFKTQKEALSAVERNGDALRYVKEQTPEICQAAVEQNGYALRYVKEQTPEICQAAVERNSDALQYVDPVFFKDELSKMECKTTYTKQDVAQALGVDADSFEII